jgi:hypothetical protein
MALFKASSGSQPCRKSRTWQQRSSRSSTAGHKCQEATHKWVMHGGAAMPLACYIRGASRM